jgi:predicted transposase YdaD
VSKPYDATPKGLVEIRPPDWPAFLGVPARAVEVVDADVSTVTGAADKVLLVHADEGDRIQHFDFQSGPDSTVPRRTHGYSALLEDRHELPVESVIVLLRPEANLKAINGEYECTLPNASRPYLQFRYRVIRVWELPVETVLNAGITVLPLAPISGIEQNELPAVIERMKRRLEEETDPTTAAELWTATKIFMGLRYEAGIVEQLLQGVRAMKESTTYQAIKQEGREEGREEGRMEEVREDIRCLGERKYRASLPAHVQKSLDCILDLHQLKRLLEKILDAQSWEELVPLPKATPSARKKKK